MYVHNILCESVLSYSVLEVALRRRSEVKALVAYCLQLSFIGLHELEPLVVWQECTAENVRFSYYILYIVVQHTI